ncbi:MAG: hypothetical protein ACFCGT_09540 [Sandaracinaceae bacterium]
MLALLLSWVLVGAALLFVHVLILAQVLRAASLSWGARALALFPPFAPIVAWVGGRRVTPVVWAVLLVVYLALRLLQDPVLGR